MGQTAGDEGAMADVTAQFRYLTGLKRRIFRNARLVGHWDPQGRESLAGSETSMTEIIAEDGCPAFMVTVHFDASEVGKPFEWSVSLYTPVVSDVRGVTTEVKDANRTQGVHLSARWSAPLAARWRPAARHPRRAHPVTEALRAG